MVDLNRSLGNPRLYSEATRRASPHVRRELVDAHYLPYRQAVQSHIAAGANARARVAHVTSHSFTPELDGRVRHADVGLLYDLARPGEATLCRARMMRPSGRSHAGIRPSPHAHGAAFSAGSLDRARRAHYARGAGADRGTRLTPARRGNRPVH